MQALIVIDFPTNGTALPVCSGEARQIVSSFPEAAIPVGVKASHPVPSVGVTFLVKSYWEKT